MPALDFPSSPTNGQVFGQYVYDSTKGAWRVSADLLASAIPSPTAPTNPVSGDLWFNTNDGVMFMYLNDGNSSQWVEVKSNTASGSTVAARVDVLETTNATTNKSGFVPIIPASVAVGSGSASVGANGFITVSGASTLTLNNCFTSIYRLFKIVWEFGSTTQIDLNAQFRGGGSTVASNYYGAGYNVTFGGAAGATNTRSGGTSAWMGMTGTETGVGEVLVSTQQIYSGTYKPHMSISGYSRPHGAAFFGGFGTNAGAVTDSFVISASSSTISGNLTVYGLK